MAPYATRPSASTSTFHRCGAAPAPQSHLVALRIWSLLAPEVTRVLLKPLSLDDLAG